MSCFDILLLKFIFIPQTGHIISFIIAIAPFLVHQEL
jgi:hypothetical protein